VLKHLNILAYQPDFIIDILKNENFHLDTKKSYYSSIVFYLRLLDVQKKYIDSAYTKYKSFLDSLPKDSVYKKKDLEKDYMNYTWITLRNRIKDLCNDNSVPELDKVILSLYTDIAPRRTSDFLKMKINPDNIDDKNYNYLIFNKKEKVFIFNVWKNALDKKRIKTGVNTQYIKIINKHLIQILSDYLENNSENEFLLMENGKPIEQQRLSTIMSGYRKKYNIPFTINNLRHMFASFCKIHLKWDDNMMKKLADEMGSSLTVLEKHYIDYEEEPQKDMDKIIDQIRRNVWK
jgi:hypothetical protein